MSRTHGLSLSLLTLIVGLSSATAKAETYEQLLSRLTTHPSVTSILEQGQHFEHLSKSASGLPDPQLILGLDNVPVSDPSFDRFLPSSKVIGLRQSIPNPVLRQSQSILQKNLSKKQRLLAEYQLQQLKALLTRQLIELAKVSQLETLLNEQLNLYRLMEKDLRGQLEAGKAVYGRFSEIDVEQSDIERQLNTLRSERVNIHETLIELVETVPHITPPKSFPLEWTRSETPLYPTLIAYETVSVKKRQIDIAEADFKPNYGIQALYKQRESGDNFEGDDWFSIQASLSIPIWSKSNQTPKLNAAKAAMRSAQSAYDQTIRYWNKKMASLVAEQETALANINLLKKKKRALNEMISAAEHNYESGYAALEHILDAQMSYLSIASRLVSEQSRYQTLVVEFNSHIQSHKPNPGVSHAK